jgi:hypothetical protein
VCGIRDLGSASARASIETKTLHFKGSASPVAPWRRWTTSTG